MSSLFHKYKSVNHKSFISLYILLLSFEILRGKIWEMVKKETQLLKDLLDKDLRVVFCGTAAGQVSADRTEHYAGRGNKFWAILFNIGLTSRLLTPNGYKDLLEFGIGLTDLVKDQSGNDPSIDFKRFNRNSLRQKIEHFSPTILAFNGKKAAKVFLCKRQVEFGLQVTQIGTTRLFVVPSTSGNANRYWNSAFWYKIAELVLLKRGYHG